jgi:hypothetical protein
LHVTANIARHCQNKLWHGTRAHARALGGPLGRRLFVDGPASGLGGGQPGALLLSLAAPLALTRSRLASLELVAAPLASAMWSLPPCGRGAAWCGGGPRTVCDPLARRPPPRPLAGAAAPAVSMALPRAATWQRLHGLLARALSGQSRRSSRDLRGPRFHPTSRFRTPAEVRVGLGCLSRNTALGRRLQYGSGLILSLAGRCASGAGAWRRSVCAFSEPAFTGAFVFRCSLSLFRHLALSRPRCVRCAALLRRLRCVLHVSLFLVGWSAHTRALVLVSPFWSLALFCGLCAGCAGCAAPAPPLWGS